MAGVRYVRVLSHFGRQILNPNPKVWRRHTEGGRNVFQERKCNNTLSVGTYKQLCNDHMLTTAVVGCVCPILSHRTPERGRPHH